MKIGFLSRYQDQNPRGAEVFVAELSKRLGVKHQVEVLSGPQAGSLSVLLSGRYDLVIPINGRWQVLLVSLARLIGRYKVVISGHSGIGRDDIWNIVVGKPDVFVALTEQARSWARGWAWGSRVVKIPNGVDLKQFSPVGEKISFNLPKPVVLSVGALVWYKYHQRAIEAVSKMAQGSLLIVGEGPRRSELVSLGQARLKSRFKLLAVPYREMPKVYRSADIFTLPSWEREAFGLVYLEALASGLPVVAPNDQSRREIVGNAGILVDVTQPGEYAAALLEASRKEWGPLPRLQAERFSWTKVAKLYLELFDSLE